MSKKTEGKVLKNKHPDLATTLEALKQGEREKLNATIFYGLSGLKAADFTQLKPVWEALSPAYRRKVVRRLADLAESNLDMNYRAIGRFTLEDSDPAVREAAIEVLFDDQSIELMNRLIDMAQWDEVREVRAAAASALGRFILAGELGELPERETVRAQEAMIGLLTNENEEIDVRRRALEAIANCSIDFVEEAINEAYTSYDRRMRVSSVFAMGRSCDEQWSSTVVRELDSSDPEMRYEAARAAGEIEVRAAVPQLVKLAFDADREIKEVAIWSLGEIGGRDAMKALNALVRSVAEKDDPDLLEAVEDALANASLVGDQLDLDD
jgi:HEAT repeat protein